MHPSSIHTINPAKDTRRPSVQSAKAAPTLPTPLVMAAGVENIPVPMTRPTTSIVVENRPRCRPSPLSVVSLEVGCVPSGDEVVP
jgi:hypothetical protein